MDSSSGTGSGDESRTVRADAYPEDMKGSITFSLNESADHVFVENLYPVVTEAALFGISSGKLLAYRCPEPGTSEGFDYLLGDFSELQDWVTIYLHEKISSLSDPEQPFNPQTPFGPFVPLVLIQILDNFYELATSLVDVLVGKAAEEAKRRVRSDLRVEVEDFAIHDFDLSASGLNPLRCKLGYQIRSVTDMIYNEEAICRACGKPRDTQSSGQATPPTRKTKPRGTKATNKKRSTATASVRRRTTKAPKADSEMDAALLADENTAMTAGPSSNQRSRKVEPAASSSLPSGSSSTPRAAATSRRGRARRSPAPSSISTRGRKGKQKAIPALQDENDDASAARLMPPPQGLPPFHDTTIRPPSTPSFTFRLRRGGAAAPTTEPVEGTVGAEGTAEIKSPRLGPKVQRMSE